MLRSISRSLMTIWWRNEYRFGAGVTVEWKETGAYYFLIINGSWGAGVGVEVEADARAEDSSSSLRSKINRNNYILKISLISIWAWQDVINCSCLLIAFSYRRHGLWTRWGRPRMLDGRNSNNFSLQGMSNLFLNYSYRNYFHYNVSLSCLILFPRILNEDFYNLQLTNPLN